MARVLGKREEKKKKKRKRKRKNNGKAIKGAIVSSIDFSACRAAACIERSCRSRSKVPNG
jgi:hypothetical protein